MCQGCRIYIPLLSIIRTGIMPSVPVDKYKLYGTSSMPILFAQMILLFMPESSLSVEGCISLSVLSWAFGCYLRSALYANGLLFLHRFQYTSHSVNVGYSDFHYIPCPGFTPGFSPCLLAENLGSLYSRPWEGGLFKFDVFAQPECFPMWKVLSVCFIFFDFSGSNSGRQGRVGGIHAGYVLLDSSSYHYNMACHKFGIAVCVVNDKTTLREKHY